MFRKHRGFFYFVMNMEYIFTLGLGLLILGIWSLKNRIARIKNGNRAIATIIEIKEYFDSDNDRMYKPVFKFFTRNNEEIVFDHRVGSSSHRRWAIGKEVKVIYKAENPNKVILLTLFNAFAIPLILFILALLLLFISSGYYWAQYFFNSLH